MAYGVEVTDVFKEWYEDDLDASEQASVARVVEMLVEAGPTLRASLQLGNHELETWRNARASYSA